MQTEQINAIVLSEPLLQDIRLSQAPEWQAFLPNFAGYSDTKLVMDATDRARLIAHERLATRPQRGSAR